MTLGAESDDDMPDIFDLIGRPSPCSSPAKTILSSFDNRQEGADDQTVDTRFSGEFSGEMDLGAEFDLLFGGLEDVSLDSLTRDRNATSNDKNEKASIDCGSSLPFFQSDPAPDFVQFQPAPQPDIELMRWSTVSEEASIKARDFDQDMANALRDIEIHNSTPSISRLFPQKINIATMTLMVNLAQDNINLQKISSQMKMPHVQETLRRCGITSFEVRCPYQAPPSSMQKKDEQHPSHTDACLSSAEEGPNLDMSHLEDRETTTLEASTGGKGVSDDATKPNENEHHRRCRNKMNGVDLKPYFQLLELPSSSTRDQIRQKYETVVKALSDERHKLETREGRRGAEENENLQRLNDRIRDVQVAFDMLKEKDFQNAVILKYEDRREGSNNKAIKFFCNGTLHVTGPKSTQECLKVADIACRVLNAIHRVRDPRFNRSPFTVRDFNVQLINTNFVVPHRFRLSWLQRLLAQTRHQDSSFDPQMHAALNTKVPVYTDGIAHSVVVLVFDSGNIIITRVIRGNDLREAHKFICSFLADCIGTPAMSPWNPSEMQKFQASKSKPKFKLDVNSNRRSRLPQEQEDCDTHGRGGDKEDNVTATDDMLESPGHEHARRKKNMKQNKTKGNLGSKHKGRQLVKTKDGEQSGGGGSTKGPKRKRTSSLGCVDDDRKENKEAPVEEGSGEKMENGQKEGDVIYRNGSNCLSASKRRIRRMFFNGYIVIK